MIVFPNAKINLGLHITAKRSDGFHDLSSLFYPVDWLDILEILPSENTETRFTSSGIDISGSAEDNLCLKVYNELKKKFGLPAIQMHLHKDIPVGAGLGGGSSDAAAAVKILNIIFDLNMSEEAMMDVVRKFGSDCAFFIRNVPVLAKEKGDVFENTTISLSGKFIVMVYPDIFISTKEAYSNIKAGRPVHTLEELLKANISEWKHLLQNDFEKALFPLYPILPGIKEKLYAMGAVYASMSGSGSTVYGIFDKTPVVENIFPSNYRIHEGVLK